MDSERGDGGGADAAATDDHGATDRLVFRDVEELLELYGYSPYGGKPALESLIYTLTTHGASVETEDRGLSIWSRVAGTDAFHPTFPMTQATFLDVLRMVDEQQAKGPGHAEKQEAASGLVDRVVVRPDRTVQVQLEQEDWDDVNGDVFALTFHIPSMGSFELLGNLGYLQGLLEDASGLVRDEQEQRERLAREGAWQRTRRFLGR